MTDGPIVESYVEDTLRVWRYSCPKCPRSVGFYGSHDDAVDALILHLTAWHMPSGFSAVMTSLIAPPGGFQ